MASGGVSSETQMSIEASSMFPGFRFSPTDVELIPYYLNKKLDGYEKCVEVILEIEICRYEPWDLPERILGKIANPYIEEVCLAFNVKTDLGKLKETMSSIKAVLLDAERQQHPNENLLLCMWKLRDIFYDAEDVIDDFKCEALNKQVVNQPNKGNSLFCSLFGCHR